MRGIDFQNSARSKAITSGLVFRVKKKCKGYVYYASLQMALCSGGPTRHACSSSRYLHCFLARFFLIRLERKIKTGALASLRLLTDVVFIGGSYSTYAHSTTIFRVNFDNFSVFSDFFTLFGHFSEDSVPLVIYRPELDMPLLCHDSCRDPVPVHVFQELYIIRIQAH